MLSIDAMNGDGFFLSEERGNVAKTHFKTTISSAD